MTGRQTAGLILSLERDRQAEQTKQFRDQKGELPSQSA